MIVVSAVMIWNCLKLALWTESPVVVVLSGSMEPSMYRGDILLVHKNTPVDNGDIIIYQTPGEQIPIVHRVVDVKTNKEGKKLYLTKGDNNNVDDRGLYPRNVFYLEEEHIIGKVLGICPYAGYVTILLNDYPQLKIAVLGSMLLSVLISKDPNQ